VLAVPVPKKDGEVRYVISMSLPADTLSSVYWGEALGAGMIASVLDGNGKVLAHSAEGDRPVGKQLLPGTPLPDHDGWIRARDVKGTNVVAAVVPFEVNGGPLSSCCRNPSSPRR
jgi:hypothetical protein